MKLPIAQISIESIFMEYRNDRVDVASFLKNIGRFFSLYVVVKYILYSPFHKIFIFLLHLGAL